MPIHLKSLVNTASDFYCPAKCKKNNLKNILYYIIVGWVEWGGLGRLIFTNILCVRIGEIQAMCHGWACSCMCFGYSDWCRL